MKKTSTYLAAIGGITLFAVASVVPAAADPSGYHGNAHWSRHHDGRDVIFGVKPRRHLNEGRQYFGDDPGRYFGVGPGSYECYGYDCTW
jgi:hypothetical protein